MARKSATEDGAFLLNAAGKSLGSARVGWGAKGRANEDAEEGESAPQDDADHATAMSQQADLLRKNRKTEIEVTTLWLTLTGSRRPKRAPQSKPSPKYPDLPPGQARAL